MLTPASYEIYRVFYVNPGQPGHFFFFSGTLSLIFFVVPGTFAFFKKKSQADY
jgi:hypothetical protein